MHIRVCPKCRSLDVHRSRRRNLGEKLLTLAFLRTYRCGSCEHRFFASIFSRKLDKLPSAPPDNLPSRPDSSSR